MRKRTYWTPAPKKMLHLLDRIIDFAEALPPQTSAAEDARKALLAAADEVGYKHKIPK